MAIREKRKSAGLPEEGEDPDTLHIAKKAKASSTPTKASEDFQQEVLDLRDKALDVWVKQMNTGTEAIYKDIFGEQWKAAVDFQNERLAMLQEGARRKESQLRIGEAKRKEKQKVKWEGDVFLDDWGTMF